ncbi:unnamed protein product [Lathyrus sativus]|nr:unnamed protein product [Lathyrus sativus]
MKKREKNPTKMSCRFSPSTPTTTSKTTCVIVLLHVFVSFTTLTLTSSTSSTATFDSTTLLNNFRHSNIISDPKNFLSNWSLSSSPCFWQGIICSNSGEITTVNLAGASLSGNTLDLFTFTSIPSLQHLLLHGNFFSSFNFTVSNSKPCSLITLDVSSTNFSGNFPFENLVSCYSLSYLNLSMNFITSLKNHSFLGFGNGGFSSLIQLDMSRNMFSDVDFVVHVVTKFESLVFVNFSDNRIYGELSDSLVPSVNLVTLDLSHNLLFGKLPYKVVGDSVEFLDFSSNNFSLGFSEFEFGDCKKLVWLSLSHNVISDFEFPQSLRNCQKMESLDLSRNRFKMKIPGVVLGELRNLKELYLGNNHFNGEIPNELGSICGSLEILDLSMNKLSGEFPLVFENCSSLKILNLTKNYLYGDFLDTVIRKLSNLRYLSVSFNNITGNVPLSIVANCTQLRVLDLSANGFTGNVHSMFCPSKLEKLLIADNYLSGNVPAKLGECKSLKTIDFSFNNLSGSIPLEVWFLPNLSDLIMWANSLTGEIPEGICVNGGNLETLILNNNFISGLIPKSIANCTNIIWVSLANNRITGEIPVGIGNLNELAILQLGNNLLVGNIPSDIGMCKRLIWLDLTSNNLTGPIPSELTNQAGLVVPGRVSGKQFVFVRNEGGTNCRGAGGLVEFEGIRVERLQNFPMVHSCPLTRIYSGYTVYTFANNGSMIYLDLSYNFLSGTIPGSFGTMSYLQVLNLGHNRLDGKIPETFGLLKAIGVLDLSHNNLQGLIPGSLQSLSFLSDFDVSNNKLVGSIPSGGQLTTFPASRYENNSDLCGVPLPLCSASNHSVAYNSRKKKTQSIAVLGGISVLFFLLFIVVVLLALYRVRKVRKKDELREKYMESLPTSGTNSWKLSGFREPLSINVATFEKPLRKLTFAHLLEATNGFSSESLIGSGGFGEVYKAKMKDGSVVAIKKLIHVTGQGDREFMAEMETIGKIKHRNLVPLLGYCKVGDERLLVYEYMKYGSLETVLHERTKNSKLAWETRKNIALGSARGLAFLHHSCIPHIIHRDMKSSNILLDENFEARVSDFGMARLVNALDTHLTVSTLAGTPGYVPPEYYQSFRCTAKGDVYSYGVILLELLSGKRPIDSSEFGDDNNLVGWSKKLYRERRVSEILDPDLASQTSGEGEVLQYLRIAFECLEERPYRRPTMIQVMAMFKELQAVDTDDDSVVDGFSMKDSVIDEA